MNNLETLVIIIAAPLSLTLIGLAFGWHYRRRVEAAMRASRTEKAPSPSPVLAVPSAANQTRLSIREIGAIGATSGPGSDRECPLRLALLTACAVHFILLLLGMTIARKGSPMLIYFFMASELLLTLLLLRAGRWVWAGAALLYAACGFAIFPEIRNVSHFLLFLDAGQAVLYPAVGGLLLLLRPIRVIVSLLLGFVAFFLLQTTIIGVLVLVANLTANQTITPSSISSALNESHGLFLVAALTQIAAGIVFFWILGRDSSRDPVLGLCALVGLGVVALILGHGFHYPVPIYIQAATLGIPLVALMYFLSWLCLQGLNRLRERQWLASEYDRSAFPWAYLALVAWGFSGSSAGSLMAAMAFPAAVIVHRALVRLRWSQNRHTPGKRLVLLRVFGRPRQSIRLLAWLRSPWRLIGSVDLILGTDIATFDVSPAALEAYLKGRFHGAYLQNRDDVDRRLAAMDRRLGGDGYYPIHQLRCFESTWRYTMVKLIAGADAVLMDLRGFNESNRGCVFELTELVNRIELDRIVVMADRNTDRKFLRRILEQAWAGLREESPNHAKRDPVLKVASDHGALASFLLRAA
jgi:hypothetical protein